MKETIWGLTMNSRKVILIAGEVILDIAPAFLGEPVSKLEDRLIPGRAMLMGKCSVYAGAMGNTALAVKRMGGSPVLAGRIGNDLFGRVFQQIMEDEKVENALVTDPEADTPYSIGLSVPGIDRMFLYYPDAAWRFTGEDVSDLLLRKACILHFGYPMAMKRMYEEEGKETVSLLKRGREQGAITSMDFCFIDEMEDGPHQDWRRILKNVGPYLDVFAPSIEELMYYIDRENYDRIRKEEGEYIDNIDILRDVEPIADELQKLGIGIVVIKCGIKGIYLKTSSASTIRRVAERLPICIEEWADRRIMQPAYPVEQVVSAAGAGDVTIAAFLLALQRGLGPETSLKLAACAGARCVMSYDSYSNLMPLEELLKEID